MATISLSDLYDQKLAAGALHPDADQQRAVQELEKLRQSLAKPARFWRKTPKGFYFHGGVGRGKSMVMDLFFATAPLEKKRRVHFHAFMLEVHDFLHQQRSGQDRIDDSLISCADKISREVRLLCLDEFQVKDVADAMILERLFTALFKRGVVVVMTSNVAPDDLYADGLQRDRFLPFIGLLKQTLHIFPFSGETDYRLNRLREMKVYFSPHDAAADRKMDGILQEMAAGRAVAPAEIAVKGRNIHVPAAVRETADFSFAELCLQPKSALDYLELVKRFRVFILRDVPVLDEDLVDATTRFIMLVDTLYDHRAQLVMSAAAPPEQLYRGGSHAKTFARTVSRLQEMQSREYRSK